MQITSDSGTREVTLETGSYFFSECIAWHEAVNVGDTTVSYLMVEPKYTSKDCPRKRSNVNLSRPVVSP